MVLKIVVALCMAINAFSFRCSLQPKVWNHASNSISMKMSDQVVDEYTDPVSIPTDLTELKELVTQDPLAQEVDMISAKSIDWFINTAIILLIGAIVLSKVALVNDGITRGWTASEVAYRIPLDNWLTYNEILAREPIVTKGVTSATVYTIGDILSQRTEGKDIGELDRMRVVRSMLAGLIAHGPLSHVWYNWSEDLFEYTLKWTEWWSFFPKVILDQTTWGPIWNNIYILLLGLMKRETLESIWGDVKRTTIPLIVSGLKLWPLAHCITYGVIPVENRLLWVDLVEILWVVILSTQAAGSAHDVDTSNEAETSKI